jgi:hypothetical protein
LQPVLGEFSSQIRCGIIQKSRKAHAQSHGTDVSRQISLERRSQNDVQKVFEKQEQVEKRLSVIELEFPKIEKKEGEIHDEVSKLRNDLTLRAILKL